MLVPRSRGGRSTPARSASTPNGSLPQATCGRCRAISRNTTVSTGFSARASLRTPRRSRTRNSNDAAGWCSFPGLGRRLAASIFPCYEKAWVAQSGTRQVSCRPTGRCGLADRARKDDADLTDKTVGPARRYLAGDAPGLLTRLRRDALQALAAGPLYHHTLIGPVPADLTLRIGLRWPGDPRRGEAIASGEIELGGELIRNPSPRWLPPSAGLEWIAAWHGFGWIADLTAAGGSARDAASDLVRSW